MTGDRTRRPAPACDRWHAAPPTLRGGDVQLREVQTRDAEGLLEVFSDPQVRRFASSSPRTLAEFAQFIRWGRQQRRQGRYHCLTVVGPGQRIAGLFQLWPVEPGFTTAEWGFAIASRFWGAGLFAGASQLLLRFAFDVLSVRRLECRSAARNARAASALLKLGATVEGTLREGLVTPEGAEDYVMYSILRREWMARLRRATERT